MFPLSPFSLVFFQSRVNRRFVSSLKRRFFPEKVAKMVHEDLKIEYMGTPKKVQAADDVSTFFAMLRIDKKRFLIIEFLFFDLLDYNQ